MSLHESRLSLVWERTVEAMAVMDHASYDQGEYPDPLTDIAMQQFEAILILSRADLPEPATGARKRPQGAILTGFEVPLHG